MSNYLGSHQLEQRERKHVKIRGPWELSLPVPLWLTQVGLALPSPCSAPVPTAFLTCL